jgi:FAD/FMN-containing dehydrogenase
MASRIGIESASFTNEVSTAHWQQVRDFPLRQGALIYRVTVPRMAVAPALKTICGRDGGESAPAMAIDTTAGVIWIAGLPNREGAEQFPKLITLAQQHHGHAVMFAAPPELKNSIDVWGPPPPALPLMRELKRQFDPQGILNAGRFLSGL